MVDLRYVFNLLSVLNERPHSADVIGNVHKMRIKVWMLGKNLSIACCECLNCTCGKVGILSAAPLSLPSQELNINHMRRRKVVLIKLQRCFNVRISVSDGYQLWRRLKRLDKTASLVGLKYVFISDCRWSRRGIATALSIPTRDGRHNSYICHGSDRQIKPLGPDVFDVVSDVLEIVRDIITVSVRLVDI